MKKTRFEWDVNKDAENQEKHGISFSLAQHAFADPCRVIAEDLGHSETEKRYFCFGNVEGGILTVRFSYRWCHSHIWRRLLAERQGSL